MATKASKQETNLSDLPNDAVIRLPDVLRMYPVSSSTWWAGVASGRYPTPVALGPRARGWRIGEIRALTSPSAAAEENSQTAKPGHWAG